MRTSMQCVFVFAVALLLFAVIPHSAHGADANALVQAEIETAEGNFDAAFETLSDRLADNWLDADAHEAMGRFFEERDLPEAAIASYEQAAAILTARAVASPRNSENSKDALYGLMSVSGRISIIYAGIGDYTGALRWGQQAYYLGSTDAAVLRTLADNYFSMKRHAFALPVLDRAIAALSASEGEDEIAAVLHSKRGVASYYTGDFGASLGDYTLAEKFGMSSSELYGNWAFALEGLERWQDALEMWLKVSKMDVPSENIDMVKEHIEQCKARIE